jgi:hypothetical protein
VVDQEQRKSDSGHDLHNDVQPELDAVFLFHSDNAHSFKARTTDISRNKDASSQLRNNPQGDRRDYHGSPERQ